MVATATATSSGPNIVLGPGKAGAFAHATGVTQDLGGTALDPNKSALAVLLNTGTFTVSASATAGGTALAGATAGAFGWDANATSGDSLTISGTNTGIFQVQAFAAGVAANALAKGIDIDPGTLNGTITNSGTYVVSATALGAAVLGGASTAKATGIDLTSNSGNVTVINTGKFSVQAAVDSTSGTVVAVGVNVNAESTSTASVGTSSTTIDNDGGVMKAGISTDSGKDVQPGIIVMSRFANNGSGLQDPITINLESAAAGPAFVEGDIDIRNQDVINVSGGETDYVGVINNAFNNVWTGMVTTGNATTPQYNGTLNINSGGNLYLEDRSIGGAQYAAGGFVNQFNDNAGSTLTLELPALAPGAGLLANPEIFANNATLAGTLVLRPDLQLFPDTSAYTIVDTNKNAADGGSTGGVITGQFTDSANVTQPSVLLDAVVTYPTPETAVLTVNRVPFNAVPGLTVNQASAGSGIEHVYHSVVLGTPFANLVLTEFTQTAATYPGTLDQLAGEVYPNYLQWPATSADDFHRIISEEIDCSDDYQFHSPGAPTNCRDPHGRGVGPCLGLVGRPYRRRPGAQVRHHRLGDLRRRRLLVQSVLAAGRRDRVRPRRPDDAEHPRSRGSGGRGRGGHDGLAGGHLHLLRDAAELLRPRHRQLRQL